VRRIRCFENPRSSTNWKSASFEGALAGDKDLVDWKVNTRACHGNKQPKAEPSSWTAPFKDSHSQTKQYLPPHHNQKKTRAKLSGKTAILIPSSKSPNVGH
jgi:hypothetical protein